MNQIDKAISYYYSKIKRDKIHLKLNEGINGWLVESLQEELIRDEIALDALELLRDNRFSDELP